MIIRPYKKQIKETFNLMISSKHRRSIRLNGYDYSTKGSYFVTICTLNRKCLFGNIETREIKLNNIGEIVKRYWKEIPQHFPHVMPGDYVIMPNHIHGILVIEDGTVGAKNFSPSQVGSPRGTSKTIGSVIRGFKIGVTKWIRQHTKIEHIWQRNFYEHVIRDEDELNLVREYIQNNPKRWEMDRENPEAENSMEELFY